MPSRVIRTTSYDPGSRELLIEFRTGKRYLFSEVPESVAHALETAFAKGTYFNSRIRDRFPSRELTGAADLS